MSASAGSEPDSLLIPSLLTLMLGLVPATQALAGEPVLRPVLVVLGLLAYIWYFTLRTLRKIFVFDDEKVIFKRGCGTRVSSAREIERIRPWCWLSRYHFVIELKQGKELLFDNPTLTSNLAHELSAMNPELEIVRVPEPPEPHFTR